MDTRRPPPAWADSEPIEALQRAAYAMVEATESIKRHLQAAAGPLSPWGGDASGGDRSATDSPDVRSPSGVPISAHDDKSASIADQAHVDQRVWRQAVLPPGILSSRYDDLFSESPESLETRLALVNAAGSSSTLVPARNTQTNMDIQYPEQSYKGSPPPKMSIDARTLHRHSSHEPGRRRGFRRKTMLNDAVPIGLFKSMKCLSHQPIEDDSVKLMASEQGFNQHPPKSDVPAPVQLENLRFWQEIWFVLVICLAQMLMLTGLAQAMVPAQMIGRSFRDTNTGILAWYSAAYGLTSATFVLPSGRLGDLFGHRKIFLIGCVWFSVWSLAAGFAPNVEDANYNGNVYFCFCRAMQGIGPSLLIPNGQAMLGRTYPPGARKNTVLCLFGASAPLGFVLGGIVASLFAEHGIWPWAFWLMAIICAVLGGFSAIALPRPRCTRKKETGDSLWIQLDGYGMVLGVSGLILVNFSVNQAPIVSWSTPYIYFSLIIGMMLIWGFVRHEYWTSKYPLVPISALKSTTNFVLGCTGAGWGCFGIWIYYSFAILEVFRGWTPLKSCIHFSPAPISGLTASLLVGYMIMRVKPHWIMLMSMFAFFLGSLLFATAPLEETYWLRIFLSILIMPFGMDMSNPAATILLSNSVSMEHQGIAASLVVTTVNYSISLALGISGTIEVYTNEGKDNMLTGVRAGQYFGTGLGFMGVLLALCFSLRGCYCILRKRRKPEWA